MKTFLVYPHQLFENTEIFNLLNKKEDLVLIIEEPLLFTQYKFHKQKLIFHRATMKKYSKYLEDLGYEVKYVEFDKLDTTEGIQKFTKGEVISYDPVDNWLEKRLRKVFGDTIKFLETPMFINSKLENGEYFKNKKPFMKNFYEWQRKRLKVLVDTNGKPIGGKFSFDEDNRKKLPKGYSEPENISFKEDTYTLEAKKYIEDNFGDNYGEVEDFNYATDFSGAKKVFHNFLEHRLKDFGIYEDAISKELNYLNHSILTPYLNSGLLIPLYVIKETLKFAKSNSKKIPINSLEGFIRQIIGWREFMRAMYEIHGVTMRNGNNFHHDKKLGKGYWSGNTGNIVVDTTIKKVLSNAYSHHIERLMILGNYMLLSEHDPNDVYKWFMEMYIDSYDWVMVPNVYGMSQFADGGIFATKPYISGSNYILKMSDYKKDGVWEVEWDKLFWSFLKKHKKFFEKNIRFKMLLSRIK